MDTVRAKTNDTLPASAVFDNGRRGEPRLGCDCVQCFGYCLINQDEADRLKGKESD
jgi:hypothetical protein